MPRTFFIHATNIHQGGGRSLLMAIMNTLPNGVKMMLSLDSRMPLPERMADKLDVKRVEPSLTQRFISEICLYRKASPGDVVLCFGNLPPLFRLHGRTVVFLQNRYLIDSVELNTFPLRTRLRLMLERFWLASRLMNVDEFIVQTPSMQRLLEKKVKGRIPVRMAPFMEHVEGYSRRARQPKPKGNNVDFVYVASGEPHKNHRQLLDAWCLLSEEGMYPSLTLTLDETNFAELCEWIDEKSKRYRLKVKMVGSLPLDETRRLYASSDALIYPSTFESFGLPLIEARQAGLPVLASELDYVRDLIDPEETFDPDSAHSIVRAVKRFLGTEESPLVLQDPTAFLMNILGRER